jgi:hypothetical protein
MTLSMKKTRLFFLLLSFLALSGFGFAQDVPDAPPIPIKTHTHPPVNKMDILDKLYYGGNFGFAASGGGYFLELSPTVGYHVTQKFSVGLMFTYMHYDFIIPQYGELNDNVYGGGIFARYFILDNLFAHAEARVLNGQWDDGPRFNLYPVLVGGGYRALVGSRSSFFAMLLYDLNYSPYNFLNGYSPFYYTVGFGIGL